MHPSFVHCVGRAFAAELAVVAIASVVTTRVEVAIGSAAWLLFTVPGVLVSARLLPAAHPLASCVAAPAVATILAALPWALASLAATLLHAPLFAVWWIAFALGVVGVVVMHRWRSEASVPESPSCSLVASRTDALSLLAALASLSIGIAVLGAFKADPHFRGFALRWLAGARLEGAGPAWWLGVPPLVAAALLFVRARATADVARLARSGPVVLAWTLAVASVGWAARVAFCLPDRLGVPWSLDDVTYVAEAVDAAAGLPLGLYEPSLGAELGRVRSSVSVLGAPLVATLSLVTGVAPVVLHHCVLPPLFVVLGASATAAAATLVLGARPLVAPLTILSSTVLTLGSWCYAANAAQYLLLEAAQPKSLHLAFLPLQLATIARAAVRGGRRELVLAASVAVVAHCVHPFATIVGVLASSAALLVAPLLRARPAAALLLLVLQLGLGFETWATSRTPSIPALETSDREHGELRESRDLLRDGDAVRPVLDPTLALGADLQALLGLGLTGLAVAGARRRRELGVVAAISVVAVAVCFVEPLGRVVQLALHPSIYWRARWMIPTPLLLGLAAITIFDALLHVLRRNAAAVIAVLVIPLGMAATATAFQGHWLWPGPPPVQASKLDAGSHAVATWLARHDPGLALAPARLSVELPQLASARRLVRSRPKALLPPRIAIDDTRRVLAAFDADALDAAGLALLLDAYSLDAIVIEASQPRVAALLASSGWFQCEVVAQYSIWFLAEREEPSSHLAHCSDVDASFEPRASTNDETKRKQ